MKIIKQISVLLMVAGLISSCIERYYPESTTGFISRLVIEGTIIPDEGEQEIIISNSSSPEKPDFLPVSGCIVKIEDEKGNSFLFQESKNAGHYRGTIDGNFVIIGANYRLFVQTPNGNKYISKYEKLLPCPAVDSVYYELQTKEKTVGDVEDGLQFFVDFKGDDTYGKFYRWQLVETYEYHSSAPLQKWLDVDGNHSLAGPDFSNFVCYKTDYLNEIFVLSTEGFTQNSYKKYKLHFVNDRTQRLLHKYSLLVKQYSLSAGAYDYWRSLKKNNQETVDMFGKQPANVKGNIYNLNDTTERVLGYFIVSSVRSKRIMVHSIDGLTFKKLPVCKAMPIQGPLPSDRPLYFADAIDESGQTVKGIISEQCIFCALLGGTTKKPNFWDKK